MKEYYNKIYKGNKQLCIKILEKYLQKETKKFIVTANPEIFVLAKKNEMLQKALLDKECMIVADGIGVVFGGKRYNMTIEERIPGVELCQSLLEYADRTKKSIFLFGSKKHVLKKLVDKIRREYPGISIKGAVDGYINDKDYVFEQIKQSAPDIAFVALGAPEQELLIYRHLDSFSKGIFIGVGGSFDVLSGAKKRAPKAFIKTNTEWLYRIVSEPKRLKRFWNSNIKFLIQIYFKKA